MNLTGTGFEGLDWTQLA